MKVERRESTKREGGREGGAGRGAGERGGREGEKEERGRERESALVVIRIACFTGTTT